MHETRGFDATTGKTLRMRRKEAAADYRFMPEPDLLPLYVDDATVTRIKNSMPELPDQVCLRLEKGYDLSTYECNVLIDEDGAVTYFENTVTQVISILDNNEISLTKIHVARVVWNWLANDVFGRLKNIRVSLNDASKNLITESHFVEFITLLVTEQISTKTGKDVLDIMLQNDTCEENFNNSPKYIVKTNNWEQLSDVDEVEAICIKVINDGANAQQLKDYLSGKKPKLFGFFVGKTLKESNGKANPKLVNKILKSIFEKLV